MSSKQVVSIYIIEDDEIMRKVLVHDLKKHFAGRHIRLSTFKTGEQCHLVHEKPDIAIIDYHLNGKYKNAMNGVDMVHAFRAQSPGTHIILFTGEDNGEVIRTAISLGISDYVIKNELMFLKLRSVLEQCLQLMELRLDLRRQKAIAVSAVAISAFALVTLLGLALFLLASRNGLSHHAGEVTGHFVKASPVRLVTF